MAQLTTPLNLNNYRKTEEYKQAIIQAEKDFYNLYGYALEESATEEYEDMILNHFHPILNQKLQNDLKNDKIFKDLHEKYQIDGLNAFSPQVWNIFNSRYINLGGKCDFFAGTIATLMLELETC